MSKRSPSRLSKKATAARIPSITEVSGAAEQLDARGDRAGAIAHYREWLSKIDANASGVWVVWFNLGVLLRTNGQVSEAIDAYTQALKSNPASVHARINLGTTLEAVGRVDEAIEQWRRALQQLDATDAPPHDLLCAVLNNLGRRLEIAQQYTEAETMLNRSLQLDPRQDAVLYHRIYLRQKQCAWPIYADIPGITLADQQRATSAVAMLSITDDPDIQLRTARSQVPGKLPANVQRLAPPDGYRHERIRIAYLSSNFGMHAVSILTAELYELHDRDRFEVWGFCWSPEDNTEMRARVIKAMDRFVRIGQMSDAEAAAAIRAAEIDVLVDLQGLTSGCRPGILAHRPAPIQVTYLGFPGTTGLPGIDYVLADRYIIPEASRRYFTETPVYLPDCFQVNDRKRISTPPKSRREYGLPDDAFVFCAFNNNIKFTPEFFSVWMQILQRTSNTVLWLLADNDAARENLGRCADEHNVARDRLIFAPRVSVADYLGRFAAADLFLDLFPFNGGTTAADALWMGLPIVTCSGRSFASRMAGSLLHAIGLPELITTTPGEYADLAVRLSQTPQKVQALRAQILKNKNTYPLFDTPKIVRHIETAFAELVEKQSDSASQLPAPSSNPVHHQATDASVDLTVYTVLIGDKELLNDPLRVIGPQSAEQLRIRFVCLTDSTTLSSPTWQMRLIEHPLLPPEKFSRHAKTLPHLYFPDSDYSLYIDNTVVFKRLPQHSDLTGAKFRAFRHPWRKHPVDEADIVAKTGLDDPEAIAKQFRAYEKTGLLGSINSLTAGTVLLRAHHDPDVQRFGEYWWQQILTHSKRDQLSLDVCAAAAGCPIDYFPGDKRNNDFIHWPALLSERRVQGSFDDALYAWENRSDPEATRHPRAHFLASNADSERYARHPHWFDYMCNRTGSSLGSLTPPRRDIARSLESVLARLTQNSAKILLIGLRSSHRETVEAAELAAARTALQSYFRFSAQALVIDAHIPDSALLDPAPFRGASGYSDFDLVLALGLPTEHHRTALAKFLPLTSPGSGCLLLQFHESLTWEQIGAMRDMAQLTVGPMIFHRARLAESRLLPSSVFLHDPLAL